MKTTATNKEKYFWNMMGSFANAFSSLILSICINRIIGSEVAGVFAFAYANAQLMLTIGAFEVRPYQSTDVSEKYSFSTYFFHRLLTCLAMVVATIIYIAAGGFDFQKNMAVLFFSLFKMIEAFTDVYAGRFQQMDRIDLSGKLFFVRVACSTIGFIIVISLTKSLILGSVVMFLISFGLFWIYDIRFIFDVDRKVHKTPMKDILLLTKDVVPLFIGTFVLMYLSNAPKYAINDLCGDDVQNIYNILFMPAFVINLFSLFVFRPMLTSMSSDWVKGEYRKLIKKVIKLYGVILGFTGAALIAAWYLGIPVLSMLYDIDLSEHRLNLMFVMLAGGISALVTFSYYVITVMRKQALLLIGYAIAFVFAFAFANFFVSKMELVGAIFTYFLGVMILLAVFVAIIIFTYARKKKSM